MNECTITLRRADESTIVTPKAGDAACSLFMVTDVSKVIFRVDLNGAITLGTGVTPDEAAQAFKDALLKQQQMAQ